MHRPTRRTTAAVVVAAVALVPLVACGEDEGEDAGSGTTHTTAAPADDPAEPAEPTQPEADPEVLADIEERGAPTPEAVEGPVEELRIVDDVEGTGEEVTEGATVMAHYVGVVAESGEQFDSSWDRGEPISFPLDGVIQGWSEGLVGMKVGGRRTLVIPAEMAYGDTPPEGSVIPVDAPLVFTVDLAAVA